jgi:hypothetical protein
MPTPKIKFIDLINDTQQEDIDFGELVTLIKGSSIKSMAVADDFVELGLTDALNLRMNGSPDILLMSALNKGERPPVRLQLIPEGETPTAKAVETRIHALRQLYATTFLINAGRAEEAARILGSNPQADLEELLKEKDRLFIIAASEGTFWLTVFTKTGAAFKNLTNIVPLFYEEGRQALLERVRATTAMKKLDVKQKEIKVASQLVELVQKVEKIKDPKLRDRVQEALSSNLSALGKQPLSLPKPDAPPRRRGSGDDSGRLFVGR